MTLTRFLVPCAALGALCLSPSLSAAPQDAESGAAKRSGGGVTADGSSTVEPITSAVVAEFAKAHGSVKVSVAVSGTSGGFRRFVVGETDISNASRAIKKSEIKTAAKNNVKYLESLVGFDGLSVAVSRKNKIFGSDPVAMTAGELELLWSRESDKIITNWKQLGSRFADAAITLSGAASTSGTFDFFTDAINGKEGDTRADYFGTEEDQLLAEQTSKDPYGMTYFGYAFFVHNQERVMPVAIDPRRTLIDAPQETLAKINALRAKNGKKPLQNAGGKVQGVLPDVDTIGSFAYQPLTRPLFVYTNLNSLKRDAVSSLMEFYLDEKRIGNRQFMMDVGYISATRQLREANRAIFKQRTPGTAFDGEFGGLSAADIAKKFSVHAGLKKPAKGNAALPAGGR